MAEMTPISVFLVTLNESAHIAEVLDALTAFDEVVLVDSGSTDGTVEVAREKGARVIHQPWLGFAGQKNFAMSQCRNDWVLNVDGDEVIPPALARTMQEAVDSREAEAFRIYFDDLFWGRSMHPGSAKRSIVRLFNRNKARYPIDRLVHENIQLAEGAREKPLPGLVKHYGYGDTDTLMAKQNRYSSLKAEEKYRQGKSPSLLKLFCIFPLMFFKAYILRRLFLSGRRGLVHATIEAMYAFLKEAKLFELFLTRCHKP